VSLKFIISQHCETGTEELPTVLYRANVFVMAGVFAGSVLFRQAALLSQRLHM